MSNKIDVVISHGPNCVDGAVAAWCIWRKLSTIDKKLLSNEGGYYSSHSSKNLGPGKYIHPNSFEGALKLQEKGYQTVFVFAQPSDNIPKELINGKNVMILDIDFGPKLVNIINNSNKVWLIDHHVSSLNTVSLINNPKLFSYLNFSNKESAASLTWKFIENNKIPSFIDIVRIGDNWVWDDNKDAKYILKYLNLKRSFKSFQHIDKIFNTWDKKYYEYVSEGKIIIEHETAIIHKISKQCSLGYTQTNDGSIYTIAYIQANTLHSEIGSVIKKYAEKRFNTKIDFCATWKYVPHKNLVSVSLRNDDYSINLSEVAKNIKGINPNDSGGHVNSSAFYFEGLENFHNYILKSHPLYTPIYYGLARI